eukprot:6766562-Alexandrium_andersonii.AAC.1
MSSESSVGPEKATCDTELNAKPGKALELLGASDEPPERVDGAERQSRAQCPSRPHLLHRATFISSC